MSPEQAQGEAIDYRSDLFSLGSVVYFMLAGRPPFRASGAMAVLQRICHEPHRPLHQIHPETPLELSEFVDRLLAKSPHDRIASAEIADRELRRLLARWQQGGLSLRSLGDAISRDAAQSRDSRWLRPMVPQSVRSIVLTLAVFTAMVTVGGLGLKHLIFMPAPSEVVSPSTEPVARPQSEDSLATDAVPLDVDRLQQEYAAFRQVERQFDSDIQRVQRQIKSLVVVDATPFQETPAPNGSTFDHQLSDVARQMEELREQMHSESGAPWSHP